MNADDLRKELFSRLSDFPSTVSVRNTSSYIGLREKQNFVEIHKTKSCVKIVVNSKALNIVQRSWCRIVPESYLWTLDAEFRFTDTAGIDKAVELIKASYNYNR